MLNNYVTHREHLLDPSKTGADLKVFSELFTAYTGRLSGSVEKPVATCAFSPSAPPWRCQMTREKTLTASPVVEGGMREYVADLQMRLTRSYEELRAFDADRARMTAERRVSQLVAAVEADRGMTDILVLSDAKKAVGAVAFSVNRDESHLFLWDILIQEPFRRSGYGTLAMREIERIAVSAGLDRVQLSMEFGNTVSMGFFNSLGYRAVAIAP